MVGIHSRNRYSYVPTSIAQPEVSTESTMTPSKLRLETGEKDLRKANPDTRERRTEMLLERNLPESNQISG